MALCSPERGQPAEYGASSAGLAESEGPRQPSGKGIPSPGPETSLYRYPFSNVFGTYQGVIEGVCWPTMGSIELSAREVPSKLVRAFLEMPNNTDLYGRGFSHNGPHDDYRHFLEAIEKEGLPEEYLLIPTEMTVRGLHNQQRGA